jgi:predicted RNA-binding protein
MMKYWLCVTNNENWHVLRKRRIWGISERNRRQMDEVKIGDMLVFYVKPKQIGGVYEAVSKPFVDNEKVFGNAGLSEQETFPRRVKVKPFVVSKEPIPFDNVVAKLSFISYKKRWQGYLRKAMQTIPQEDYERILALLKAPR